MGICPETSQTYKNLEKLSLHPMLRESILDEDDIDLQVVVLSHYRLSKIKQQSLNLHENEKKFGLNPADGPGSAKARDRKEELLALIIGRLNELFITDNLTDQDLVNYAYTIRDKVRENATVMLQIASNTPEQAMLGDFQRP